MVPRAARDFISLNAWTGQYLPRPLPVLIDAGMLWGHLWAAGAPDDAYGTLPW